MHKRSKSQEKINHQMYMNDIKLFAKNEKRTVRIYSQYIEIELGIEKCTMLIMNGGKRHLSDIMEMTSQDEIRTLEQKDTYKYLGILAVDTFKQLKMKEKIKKE